MLYIYRCVTASVYLSTENVGFWEEVTNHWLILINAILSAGRVHLAQGKKGSKKYIERY